MFLVILKPSVQYVSCFFSETDIFLCHVKSYAFDLNNPGADKSDLYGRDSDTILCESCKQCNKLSLTN